MSIKSTALGAAAALALAALPAADALAVAPGDDGIVVYSSLPSEPDQPSPLKAVGLDGTGDRVIAGGKWYDAAISPDGRKIAAVRQVEGTGDNVWVLDIDGGNAHPVNPDAATSHSFSPSWAPDSRHLAMRVVPKWLGEPQRPPAELHVVEDGTSEDRKLDTDGLGVQWVGEWSPEGDRVSYGTSYTSLYADPQGGDPRPITTGGIYAPNGSEVFQRLYRGVDLVNRDGSNRRALVRDMPESFIFAQPLPSGKRLAWIDAREDADHLVISDLDGANRRPVGDVDVKGGFAIQPIPVAAPPRPAPVADPPVLGPPSSPAGPQAPATPTSPTTPATRPGGRPAPDRTGPCERPSQVTLKLKVRRGAKLKRVTATVDGRKARARRSRGGTVAVALPANAPGTVTVRVTARAGTRTVRASRTITRCR